MKKFAITGWCLAPIAGVFAPVLVAFAQDVAPTPQTAGQASAITEEVIVTGSNIPTAEEVGPQPGAIPIAGSISNGSVCVMLLTLFRSCPWSPDRRSMRT